jgi:hypothetical protein
VTLGANASLFPIGTSSDYRPMYFGSSGLTNAGTIKVSHVGLTGVTAVSFTDGASTIQVRSNSYWTVSTANGIAGTGSPLTVRSEGTGFGLVGNVSDLRLTRSAAVASGTAGTNANTTTDPQVNRTTFSVANLPSSYYWGSIDLTFTPLPVDLLSFTAQPLSGDVILNWQTATEEDCSYFSLERSPDGTNYADIAMVPAIGGPQLGHRYAYSDNTPGPGKNFYRLKIASRTGAATYSAVVVVSFAGTSGLVLFPDPSDGSAISASITSHSQAGSDYTRAYAMYTMDVYNDQGMLVRHYSSSAPTFMVSFSPTLSPGVYVARVSATGFTAMSTFMVRR